MNRDRSGLMDRILEWVKRHGDRLPDPLTIFVGLALGVLLLSGLLAGVSVDHPAKDKTLTIENLLTGESLRRVLVEMPETFAEFPPLGLVLVVMLGIGVAERTGMIEASLKGVVSVTPDWLATTGVVLAGILSSLALDAGYVVLIPLGASVFVALDRHPLAGLAAAFAGVSAGFSANLVLTALDPLLASFSTPAAQLLDPDYVVDITANYYLMVALVPALTGAGVFVTDLVVEPRLDPIEGTGEGTSLEPLTPRERTGLKVAGVVLALVGLALAWTVVPQNGILRGPDGSLRPFLNAMAAIMLLVFLLPGLAYGITTGAIRGDDDVAEMTTEAMAEMGSYIVLAFAAAHLLAFFEWSNMGSVLAISGAYGLKNLGLTGLPLVVSFVLLTALINLFVGSASAKWALMAPVFVPMLMLVGYSPELTQAIYRVGDSVTNIITPLLPYYPLIIVFARRYDPDANLGTLIAMMLPYSVAFGIVGTALLVAWILLGLPPGPGAPLTY